MTLPSKHFVHRKPQIVPKTYWTFWIIWSLLGVLSGIGWFVSALLSGQKRDIIIAVISLLSTVAWSVIYWRIKHENW
jgi:hypothetical protein